RATPIESSSSWSNSSLAAAKSCAMRLRNFRWRQEENDELTSGRKSKKDPGGKSLLNSPDLDRDPPNVDRACAPSDAMPFQCAIANLEVRSRNLSGPVPDVRRLRILTHSGHWRGRSQLPPPHSITCGELDDPSSMLPRERVHQRQQRVRSPAL